MVLVRGKGRRERLCPVGPMAMEWIGRWRPLRRPSKPGEPALFLNHRGTRLTSRSVGRLLTDHLVGQGLDPSSSPHTLRPSSGRRTRCQVSGSVIRPPSRSVSTSSHRR